MAETDSMHGIHAEQTDEHRSGSTTSPLVIGAIASAAAAVLHAAASGIHAETAGLARLFIVLTVAQAAAAVIAFVRTDRAACGALFSVNALAAAGWMYTRVAGVSFIGGLEVAERPQIADTAAAVLAMVAVATATTCAFGRRPALPSRAVASAAILAGVLVVPGLADATTHDHGDHVETADGSADHDHGSPDAGAAPVAGSGEGAAAMPPATTGDHAVEHTDDHDHTATPATTGTDDTSDDTSDDTVDDMAGMDHDDHDVAVAVDTAQWPRPWDPTAPIDFSGVDGVTDEQVARAEQLATDTLRDLPAFADVTTLPALGYRSIGDSGTGVEHYINVGFIGDDKILDPTAPESLVYEVDGDQRTLVSAMFIVGRTPIDDPSLTDFAGSLMQWHVHVNLCWGLDDSGDPVVKGVLENPGDACPSGTVNAGGDSPMVHVWIAPHPCGPFAALEGHGAGQAAVGDGARMDQCSADHGDGHGADDTAAAATSPYDPTLPIDLSGVEGVTLQQQAYAENLVAATVRDLPQWADLDKVAAAGFHSIGDGGTGHEHYIQWDWIDDDVYLDPDHPESLVFEPQPDGSKKLVSAMFMLPGGTPLTDVPDDGGALMQWHVHGDLCFTDDPVAPQVAGLKTVGSSCRAPLVDFPLAPMIHVWIRPTPCGPFAALEGIGGGQVAEGDEVLCDHAHGAG